MHTWCHFHYFCKYHVTWYQICIHFLIFFSNIISYSMFLVYWLYCFGLQISSSIEYGLFFLQLCLLFLNPKETSQRAASSMLWNPAFKAFYKIWRANSKGSEADKKRIFRFCKLDIGLLLLPSLHHMYSDFMKWKAVVDFSLNSVFPFIRLRFIFMIFSLSDFRSTLLCFLYKTPSFLNYCALWDQIVYHDVQFFLHTTRYLWGITLRHQPGIWTIKQKQ